MFFGWKTLFHFVSLLFDKFDLLFWLATAFGDSDDEGNDFDDDVIRWFGSKKTAGAASQAAGTTC